MFSFLIENLQLLTGYRFSEYQDLVADFVSMAVGYLLAMPLAKVATNPG